MRSPESIAGWLSAEALRTKPTLVIARDLATVGAVFQIGRDWRLRHFPAASARDRHREQWRGDFMEDLPPAFDLAPLTRALLRRKKGTPAFAAGNALKIYRDARSAMHDLLYANELAEHLARNDPLKAKVREDEPVSVRGALLQHAILLCVRAMETRQRRGLQIKSQLSSENQDFYAQLVVLRNKAIAHLDHERPFGGNSFADETAVIVHPPEGGHRLDVADRRVMYQTELEDRLRDILKDALEKGREQVLDAMENVQRHLTAVTKEEPALVKLIHGHPFDAVGFFGDEEAARRFLLTGSAHNEPKKMAGATLFEGWPKMGDGLGFNVPGA